ncbi:helix-turn-helix domain-containing protein [Lactobacillus terrae]|uniref:helix-turn-helix domain-containing protein n=1 Tax=Lactobacillus terrae TaxID=2269374 RepID=UPI000C1B630A|nr:helix-turn-helix domain-containing protein [Lactobacillus terrae]
MLEEVFLGRPEVEKYKMLTVIKSLPEHELNLNNISIELDFTYQKTYNIFQSLIQDLMIMDEKLDVANNKIEDIDFDNISINKYRLFLIEDSVVFQAFNYGMSTSKPSFDNFSTLHFTSKSTLNRKMAGLRKMLKGFDLKISNSTLEISGDEKRIRWVAYLIYWRIFHGEIWPFDIVNEANIEQILHRSEQIVNPVTFIQMKYLVAISRMRLIKKNNLDNMNSYKEIFDNYPIGDDIILQSDYPLISPSDIINENKFLSVFNNLNFRSRSTSDDDYKIFSIYDISSEKIKGLVDSFIDSLLGKYKINVRVSISTDIDTINYLKEYTARIFEFFYIMSDSSVTSWQNFSEGDDSVSAYTSLYKFISDFIKGIDHDEFLGISNSVDTISHVLTQVLPSYINAIPKSDKIKVKLIVDSGSTTESELLRNITMTSYVELANYNEFEDVDLILTTLDIFPTEEELKKYPKNVKILSWNLQSTRLDYFWLLKRIDDIQYENKKR